MPGALKCARASELLGLCLDTDLDAGANKITVVSKGSRLRETIPTSVDSFVWLALYLREECPPVSPGGPLWWTRQGTPRPLTYHAARPVLQRANAALGTTPRRPGCCRIRRSLCSTCNDPAARERVHDSDLRPAAAGGSGRQGARVLRPVRGRRARPSNRSTTRPRCASSSGCPREPLGNDVDRTGGVGARPRPDLSRSEGWELLHVAHLEVAAVPHEA